MPVADMRTGVRKWYDGLPPVTRLVLTAAVVLSCLTTFHVVHPLTLALPETLGEAVQVWRWAANVVYRGNIGLGFLMSAYFLVTASTRCENEVFERDAVKYLWFLVVSSLVMMPVCWVLGMRFVGSCLVPLLVFVSCRTRPTAVVQFFLGMQVQALYFPLVLMAMDFLLGQSIVNNVVGCVVGHLYVYHAHFTPRHRAQGTAAYLPLAGAYELPQWLQAWVERERKRQLGTGPLPWGRSE